MDSPRAVEQTLQVLWMRCECLRESDDVLSAAVLHREAIRMAFSHAGLDPHALPDFSPSQLGHWFSQAHDADLVTQSLVHEAPDTHEVVEALWRTHQRALSHFETKSHRVSRKWRWGMLCVALLGCLAWGLRVAWIRYEASRNLLAQAPFSLSSKWADCVPAENQCGGFSGMKLLFHTGEERNPWVQFDLQNAHTFSQLRVHNRADTALLRAIPLTASVSLDGVSFEEIGVRDTPFETWTLPLEKPTTARYLKLQVRGFTNLHLESVELF